MCREQHEEPVGYGLVGCGGFGRFCLEQYSEVDELQTIAVTDRDRALSVQLGEETDTRACATFEDLLNEPDVELIHLATPPSTHHELALAALEAGKHVLCEKPLCLEEESARELISSARSSARILGVNLIMRYDPLCEIVDTIVKEGLLGLPLHGTFENYAQDEGLPRDHWFWDAEQSGGIFVEHGVHFFDLFRSWFGPGRVLAAQSIERPSTEVVEQVHATAVYGEKVLVNFYHGFHQASVMDRQELRLVFERGDIRLEEWVPTRLHIDALLDAETLERLKSLMPGNLDTTLIESFEGGDRRRRSRHTEYEVDGRHRISYDLGMEKMRVYGLALRRLMENQIRAIRNSSHQRRVSDLEGLTSLQMASEASRLTTRL